MKGKNFPGRFCFISIILGALFLAGCSTAEDESLAAKPVIYLYPESACEVSVSLNYQGELICTYPDYGEGWNVIARPDGTLTNLEDGKEYSYLFWEGISEADYDMSEGFVVKGEDTAVFLQETLAKLGLTPAEYNEFIVYWLPRMQGNPWNLITFQTGAYTEEAELVVTPAPETVLRVYMAFRPLQEPIEVREPVLEPVLRRGFTVVEWGGTEVKG